MKLKKYTVNGETIITTNLKKDRPDLFQSYTYVWETGSGKTYLLINDYQYRKPHLFSEREKAFFEKYYGPTGRGLGAEEKIYLRSTTPNGMYLVNADGSLTPIENAA